MLKIAQSVKITTKKTSLDEIEKFYKGNTEQLIGLEYERLSLDKNTLKNAPYEKLEKIIKHFCEITSSNLVYDNKTIIGANLKNGSSISLEPGCQLEISLSPKKDILSIDSELNKIVSLLDKIALAYDVIFVGYGISPTSNIDEIPLLQKRRYEVMDKFLPSQTFGELAQKMMRQTAGIQINLDYKNAKDAFYKLKFYNLIMPFMMGLCANSSFENNKLTNKKSYRAHVWNYTGSQRCNIYYKNIFNGFMAKKNSIKNYIFSILDIPMIFIERNDEIIEINGKITFREFMKNGYLDYFATFEDYILHQSLCFPDVRLKKCLEIRNHDSNNPKMALALCAFYKGLDKPDIKKTLAKFNYLKLEDIERYTKEITSNGLSYEINNKIDGWKVIAELLNISKSNLSSQERIYLEPILNLIKTRKTSSDFIQEYEISNAKDLIEFLC